MIACYAGMVSFQFKGIDTEASLRTRAQAGTSALSGAERLRISTHVHTRPADLDAHFPQRCTSQLGIG